MLKLITGNVNYKLLGFIMRITLLIKYYIM